MKIKIFLADDHELFRQGIHALLEDTDIEIVGEANNGKETLDKLSTVEPDILLLDISMSVMDGAECAALLKNKFPELKILVLSMYDTENHLTEMLDAGVKGYILKSGSKEELVFAIKQIFNGGMYISTEFLIKKLGNIKSASETTNILIEDLKLSERELEVLKLIVQGYTNSEIAEKLFASVRTIETRRKKLLHKTKASNTAMLIHFATVNGLV
jgi:DNA-binding NarL/FixJ family response regulator